MTSFREYRAAMAAGTTPQLQMPTLSRDVMAFQGERAGFVSRAVAAGIDVALVFLVVLGTVAVLWALSFIIDPMSPSTPVTQPGDRIPGVAALMVYGYVLNWAYWTVAWATSGRTAGNLLMGLRVVNFRGVHQRWGGAALRALFCTVFPFGLLWVIVSGANRSVQDVVLRTSVIYDWVVTIPGFTPKAAPVAGAEGTGTADGTSTTPSTSTSTTDDTT
jgi:uncharacterized RDD family membrane protein YckC